MYKVLVDTCFWIALFDERDQYHLKAQDLKKYLNNATILIPYPSLYETINDRFSKNRNAMIAFQNIIRSSNIRLLDKHNYDKVALKNTFSQSILLNRPLSFVDVILRHIIADTNIRVDYLLTFDVGDFVDACNSNNVKLIYSSS